MRPGKKFLLVGLAFGAVAGLGMYLMAQRSQEDLLEEGESLGEEATERLLGGTEDISATLSKAFRRPIQRLQQALLVSKEARKQAEQEMMEEYERTIDEVSRSE